MHDQACVIIRDPEIVRDMHAERPEDRACIHIYGLYAFGVQTAKRNRQRELFAKKNKTAYLRLMGECPYHIKIFVQG